MVHHFASGVVMPKGNGINASLAGALREGKGAGPPPPRLRRAKETVYAVVFWHLVKHPKQPFTGINS